MHRFLILLLFSSLISCKAEKEELKQKIPMRTVDSVAVESFGVRFLFSDSAKVTAELYAAHVMEVQNNMNLEKEDQSLFKWHLARAIDHMMSTDKGNENFTAMVMEEAVRSMPKIKPLETDLDEKDGDKKEKKEKKEKNKINSAVAPGKPQTLQYMEDSIHIDFLDSYGKSHSFIESKSGIYSQDDEWAVLIEDVVLKNEKGERLETDQLFWDKTVDSVYTHTPVKITTPDKIITGSGGMRSTTSFNSYVIFGTYGEVSLNAAEKKKEAPKPKPKPTLRPTLIK